jgi:ABC-type multidrug transport system ATPase subunit
VVIATHELARVRELAHRILLLRDGRLTELDRSVGLRRVAERRVEGMR